MKQKITILILKKKDIKDAIEIEMIVAIPNDLVIAVVVVAVAVDRQIAKKNGEKAKKKRRTGVEVDRLVTNMRKLPNMV